MFIKLDLYDADYRLGVRGANEVWSRSYSLQRSRQRLSRGDEALWKGRWIDPDGRAHLAERLRRALRRRHAARLGERSLTSEEQRNLETSDFRPALYTHLLLLSLIHI